MIGWPQGVHSHRGYPCGHFLYTRMFLQTTKKGDDRVTKPTETVEHAVSAPIELAMYNILDKKSGEVRGHFTQTQVNVPDEGTLTPAAYRLTANRSRLSVQLAQWTLARLSQLPADFCQGLDGGFVTAYVPLRMLRDGQVRRDLQRLEAAGTFPVPRLVLELSAEVLYEDAARVRALMRDITGAFGVRFLLSEFGGAYCPALRLGEYRFHYVLLDDTAGTGLPGAVRLAAESGAQVILPRKNMTAEETDAQLYLSARRVIVPDGRYCDA